MHEESFGESGGGKCFAKAFVHNAVDPLYLLFREVRKCLLRAMWE